MSVALEDLAQTLTILQQATALDLLGDNEAAVEMYMDAKCALDAIAPYLPREQADVVRRNADEVKHRVDAIKRDRWARERKSEFPTFPIEYVPQPIPVDDFRVPSNPTLRVFWLMRRLQSSMRQGAFLAPDLFISKEVWYQDGGGTALTHTGPKVRYLSALCDAMEKLRGVTSLGDLDSVAKALSRYADTAEELTTTLESDMGIRRDRGAAPSRLERGVRGLFQRGQQVLRTWRHQETSYELCVIWAVNTLEQAQIFERWMGYFTQAASTPSPRLAEIMALLSRIAALLYAGPCAFLLRDMAELAERYQTKCRKSAVQLFPVDVRLEGAAS